MEFKDVIELVLNGINLIVVGVIGVFAYKISKRQAEIQDSVEIYASYNNAININTNGNIPIILIQNIGTRVIYFDNYEFNGKLYELNGQVRPSTYSQAENNFYRINLPTNQEDHVSVFIYFHDVDKRQWKSKVICNKNGDNWWDVETYPVECIKK